MPSMLRSALAPLLTIVLAACSTTWFHVGNDFDLNAFTTGVNRGATTRDQVRAWLGAPSSTGVDVETDGKRYDKWNYFFAEGNMSHVSGTTLKTLQIKFDSQGIVQAYEVSQSAR
jgi:outer membrane protein assembly factor BamE (lipoprotein component of BamABCDE complex)